MQQKDTHLTTKDGLNLFGQTWEPTKTPRAAITLVHGFGEHCLRYTPYIELFEKHGYAFFGFDHRGHGQSDGKRGVIKSYKLMINDIERAVNKTRELFPDIPQFIYGHSMGGNLAFNYLLREKPNLSGAIIASPWLALTVDPGFIAKAAISVLNRILPHATINSGLELKYISTVDQEVEKYKNDPLNHGKISFRLFSDITTSGLWAIANAKKLEIDTLLVHGTADKITSPLSSKLTAKGNPNKIELVEWEGMYHELHNDKVREPLAEKVATFIDKQISHE